MTVEQILGFLSLILVVLLVFMKDIKLILVGEIIVNIIVGLNFLLLGGYSSAGMSVVAVLYTIISYIYNRKNIKIPMWMLGIFLLLYVAWGVISYQSWIDILPLVCSVLFILAVSQRKASNYRILKVVNSFIYVFYDVFIFAYTTIITHSFLVAAGIFAIIKIDVLSKNKKN